MFKILLETNDTPPLALSKYMMQNYRTEQILTS